MTIETLKALNPAQSQQINAICQLLFDNWDSKDSLVDKLVNKQNVAFFVAKQDGNEIVGFKIGYLSEKYDDCYYSWLGGVLPGFRRQGVAKQLLSEMISFCKNHEYKSLRTNSYNKFKPMLIHNLKSGFDIVGTEANEEGDTKILFQLIFK